MDVDPGITAAKEPAARELQARGDPVGGLELAQHSHRVERALGANRFYPALQLGGGLVEVLEVGALDARTVPHGEPVAADLLRRRGGAASVAVPAGR